MDVGGVVRTRKYTKSNQRYGFTYGLLNFKCVCGQPGNIEVHYIHGYQWLCRMLNPFPSRLLTTMILSTDYDFFSLGPACPATGGYYPLLVPYAESSARGARSSPWRWLSAGLYQCLVRRWPRVSLFLLEVPLAGCLRGLRQFPLSLPLLWASRSPTSV